MYFVKVNLVYLPINLTINIEIQVERQLLDLNSLPFYGLKLFTINI